MHFTDTYEAVQRVFPEGSFTLTAWKKYAAAISPELAEKCEKDAADYDFEKQVLPVLQDALKNSEGLREIHLSFQRVSKKIASGFWARTGSGGAVVFGPVQRGRLGR